MKKVIYFVLVLFFELMLSKNIANNGAKRISAVLAATGDTVSKAIFALLFEISALIVGVVGFAFLVRFVTAEARSYYSLTEEQGFGITGFILVLTSVLAYQIIKYASLRQRQLAVASPRTQNKVPQS